jgi:hypothetical protein
MTVAGNTSSSSHYKLLIKTGESLDVPHLIVLYRSYIDSAK